MLQDRLQRALLVNGFAHEPGAECIGFIGDISLEPQSEYRLTSSSLDTSSSWMPSRSASRDQRQLGRRRRRARPFARVRLAFELAMSGLWRRSAILDLLIACAAIGGMTLSVLHDLPVRTESFAASDLKTLFASTWCFAHGINAYTFGNVQSVFAAHGVVFPGSWFAHAPVYPPTTLALLVPLTALPMVPAVYSVVVVSAAIFGIAVTALLRSAAKDSIPLAGRAAIAVLCACSPLFSFALSMGNVSVVSSALCILCFVRRKHGSGWFYGMLLAIAVLLKPHLAIWMLAGMLFLPERASRGVAIKAVAMAGSFAALVVAGLAASGNLLLEARGFASILGAETSSGSSMNASSHEAIPICAQITSLHSLLGFWWKSSFAQTLLVVALLIALGAAVVWRTRTARTEPELVLAISTWMTFGLLATYHRAHDAIVLVILLPWLIQAIGRAPRLWYPSAIILLYAAFNLSVSFPLVQAKIANGESSAFITFLLLRQAALANAGLLLVMLVSMRSHFKPARATVPAQLVLSAS